MIARLHASVRKCSHTSSMQIINKTFSGIDYQLRWTGIFKSLAINQRRDRAIQTPGIEHVLDCVEENLGVSMR
jgi:hypothetical protein